MKKVLLSIVLMLISILSFSQRYKYEIKLNITNIEEIKMVQNQMFLIFDKMPTYRQSDSLLIVRSDVDINKIAFDQKIGYTSIIFNRIEIIKKDEDDEKVD